MKARPDGCDGRSVGGQERRSSDRREGGGKKYEEMKPKHLTPHLPYRQSLDVAQQLLLAGLLEVGQAHDVAGQELAVEPCEVRGFER